MVLLLFTYTIWISMSASMVATGETGPIAVGNLALSTAVGIALFGPTLWNDLTRNENGGE